ncbi:MAG TPA: glycosyltransferase family A protein [Kofleriaceae bacterium]
MKAIIIARDRVTYTRACVLGLAATPGIDEIHIVDHGSTYEPMTAYLGGIGGDRTFTNGGQARVHVHWRGNDHPRSLWTNGTLDVIVRHDERFLVTDCDIEPPADPGWLEHLGALLDLNPRAVKAGCGLRTDDLPDEYEHADRVRMWEAGYQGFGTLQRDSASGLAWFNASVDTTLALYRGLEPFNLDPAVRSADVRFMARHLSWYVDSANLAEDERYYRAHALNGVSHWLDPDGYQSAAHLPEGVQP